MKLTRSPFSLNRAIFLSFFMAIFFQACKKEPNLSSEATPVAGSLQWEGELPESPAVPLSGFQVDDIVLRKLHESGVVHWNDLSDEVVWSALVNSDSLLSVGYQPEGFSQIEELIHEIDVQSPVWRDTKKRLVDFIVAESNRLNPDRSVEAADILAFEDKPLPYFNIKVHDFEILAKLRRISVVRYAEPMGFMLQEDQRSEAGCGDYEGDTDLVNGIDYTVISPSAKRSWNFNVNGISSAWSMSQGDNITIGLIDTGVSEDQAKLNSLFSSGWSTNRFISRHGFFESCWLWWCENTGVYDDCGHGTAMAGIIAAPRTSFNSVGVAYQANLVSCRATDDVIINESLEKDGVSDSFYYLGNRSDVKIISMSLGDIFYSGQVADALIYAHNKGKLIFCAAGTSVPITNWVGVVFPASMSQPQAVTGVKDEMPLDNCNECHYGSAVDFVVAMQDEDNSSRKPVTLAMSGNQPLYVGGSSIATATLAGIAALVWAENPSMSRTQVVNALKVTSSNYPTKDDQYGWGLVNAQAAVQYVQ
jgi:subtilisin family serine protease